MEEKPTLMGDLKKIWNSLTREPTKEELEKKIEVSKLKTELAKSEIERKEVNAKRWQIGGNL